MGVTWLTAPVGTSYDAWYRQQGTQYESRYRMHMCGDCGAIVLGPDVRQHENFHQVYSNRRGQDMSKVLWCDRGDHAFKADAPGSTTLTGEQVDDNGVRVHVSEDICPEHNPFLKAKQEREERAAIEAKVADELRREYPVEGL